MERCYMGIKTGEILMKINFNSKDTKMHYYLLDIRRNSILVFNKCGGSKPESEICFRKIIKILYGIKTQNLIKKIKSLPNNDQPFLYMSFILRDRSIDLTFSDKSIKKWFYGIYYHLMTTHENYKINSCSNFILSRIKMKINTFLNIAGEQSNNLDYKRKFQIRNAIRFTNNSFAKTILLYNKFYKI